MQYGPVCHNLRYDFLYLLQICFLSSRPRPLIGCSASDTHLSLVQQTGSIAISAVIGRLCPQHTPMNKT